MPTNYTKKRRIGSIKTDVSSHILGFVQVGDQFLWTVPVQDYANVSVAATPGLAAATVPPGIKVVAYVTCLLSLVAINAGITVQSPDQPLSAANSPSGNLSLFNNVASGTVTGDFNVRTNTAGQFTLVAVGALASGYYQITKGWIDNRGK
jgi:hypothetical protein